MVLRERKIYHALGSAGHRFASGGVKGVAGRIDGMMRKNGRWSKVTAERAYTQMKTSVGAAHTRTKMFAILFFFLCSLLLALFLSFMPRPEAALLP